MKKIIITFIIILNVNIMLAQEKSITKSSQTFNYTIDFDEDKNENILNYLEKNIGIIQQQNKEIKKWNNIYKSQTIDDNINIILKKEHFEINYKNKKDILKTDILKKLKKISTDVDKIID